MPKLYGAGGHGGLWVVDCEMKPEIPGNKAPI